MFSALGQFTHNRLAWFLLASISLSLELTALYFQHVMKLEPCVMCVYERLAMMGLIIAGFSGMIAPGFWLMRTLSFALWILSSSWGLWLSIKHTDYQLNPSPFNTCDFIPTFPFNLPLDSWVPWLFNASGDCSDVVWSFLDYSMPQWLIVTFAVSALLWVLFFIAQFCIKKDRNYIR